MADPIGTTLSVDISEVKANLKVANNLIKENETQWRISASAMDDWTKEERGLNKRLETLSETIKVQEDNVKYLVEQKEIAIKQYGKESVEVNQLNTLINTHTGNLMKSRKEYAQVSSSLEKLQKENKDANEEIKDTDKESKKSVKSLDKLEKQAEDTGDGFTVAKGAIASFIGSGLSNLVSSAGNAVSSLFNLTESTLEYRRELARITTVADQVGVSGDRIIDKWIDINSVIQDDSSVTEGLNNLMTAGFTAEKELDAITKALEGASIQWAETLKFEGLSDSLQEWIGSDGASLTGQFAELLERLGYNLEDVTEETKNMTDEQRRNWAIMTLNKAGLDDISEAYREANKDMIAYNKANSDLINAQATLGEEMQPFVTIIKQSTADILYSFTDMVNGVDGAGDRLLYNIGYMAGQIYKSITDLIDTIAPVLKDVFPQILSLISENLPSMVEQGSLIITNIISGISDNIPKASNEISTMIGDILVILSDNLPTILNSALELFGQIVLAIPQIALDLASRIPEIITSITNELANGETSILTTATNVFYEIINAIPATVTSLRENLPDILNEITAQLQNAMPQMLENSKALLGKILEAIPTIITSLGEDLPQILTAILQFLINNAPAVLDGAIDFLTEIVNAIPSIVASLGTALWDILNEITGFFIDNAGSISDIGKDIVQGIIDGIKSMLSAIGEVAKWLYDNTIGKIMSFFGIKSPSTEMRDKVGKMIVQGMVDGMKSMLSTITDAGKWVFDNTIGKIKGLFDGSVDLTNIGKNIISGITDGMQSMKKAVEDSASWIYDNTVGRVKKWLGIASPSKIMRDEVGKYITQGIAVGMLDGEYYIADSAEELAEYGMTEIKDAGEVMANSFSDGFKDGMEDVKKEVKEAVEEVMTETVKEASEKTEEDAENAGKNTGKKIVDGMESSIDKYGNAIESAISSLFESNLSGAISGGLSLIPSEFGGDIISSVFDSILDKFEEGKENGLEGRELAKSVADSLIENFMNLFDNMPEFFDMAFKFLSEFIAGLVKAVPMIVGKLPQILTEICKSFIEQGVPMMYEVGKALIQGLWEGIKSIGEWIWDGVKQVGNWIVDGFKWIFGIKSPSRVMADEVGKNLALGVEEGLLDNLSGVDEMLKKGVNTSLEFDGIQRKYVTVNQTNNYAQAHSRYELYRSKHDTANAVKLALRGV